MNRFSPSEQTTKTTLSQLSRMYLVGKYYKNVAFLNFEYKIRVIAQKHRTKFKKQKGGGKPLVPMPRFKVRSIAF